MRKHRNYVYDSLTVWVKNHSWVVLACHPCCVASGVKQVLLMAQTSLWLHCGLLASLSQENSKPLLAHLCSSACASLRQAECLLTKHTNASCLSRSKGASNYNSGNYWSVSVSHCHTPSVWAAVQHCLIITQGLLFQGISQRAHCQAGSCIAFVSVCPWL